MVPSKFMVRFIALSVLSNIDVFNFSKFPEKIAKENDIIIKKGQTMFNKKITHKILFYFFTFYYNLIDLKFHLWYISRVNKGLLKYKLLRRIWIMKSTGIIRRMDELGRVVIPIEIRNQFNIAEKDPMEIYVDGSSIILKKFEPNCIFCGNTKNLLEYNDKLICEKCKNKISNLKNQY